jgi:hypothetical protein
MYMSLPRWITSRKNRPDVLRGLKRIQDRLELGRRVGRGADTREGAWLSAVP